MSASLKSPFFLANNLSLIFCKINVSEDFILKKIEDRLTAKQEGNYKLADQIRDELLKKGVVIEDQKDKTTWKFK